MTLKDMARLRLLSQHIGQRQISGPQALVSYMGAMQAQDYAMCKWAIGIRLPGVSEQQVQQALDRGEILRTHLMRPTWHLVSADDIYWLLELTAPQIKQSLRSRHKQQGLTDALFTKGNKLIEKALAQGGDVLREDIKKEFDTAGIHLDDNRLSHFLLNAELDGLICSGADRGKKLTYALLAERVPEKKVLPKEEALATLAQRYFTSHGPATLQDFIWWSGLNATSAKKALGSVKKQFAEATIGDNTYYYLPALAEAKVPKSTMHLLPAYDEYIISYRDRSASLRAEHRKNTISANGIFWPVILSDGEVVGLWKRTIKKDTVLVEPQLFKKQSEAVMKRIEKVADKYGKFMKMKTALNPA